MELPDDVDTWLAERLSAAHLLEDLGFTGQDLVDARAARELVLTDPSLGDQRLRIASHVVRLRPQVGRFVDRTAVFADKADEALVIPSVAGHGWGVLAMLALAAAVPDVREFHAQRGIDDRVSWASLADLGQQLRVHRETFGEFGLHTHSWLTTAWSGALYSMGRLQFNLMWFEPAGDDVADPTPRWVWSTHIPGTGALTPESVAESFTRAREFFRTHFADHEVSEFHCGSWLLDPRMQQLDPASNTARFQALWSLYGPGTESNADAIFFLWRRRDQVDPSELPTDSSLRRLVVGEMLAGRPWRQCRGLIPA